MRDAGDRIAAAAIDQPLVADRFVALDQAQKEALHFGPGIDDPVEVLPPADHHLAADDRLDAVVRAALAGQDSLAGKAQGDDLPPPGAVGLVLGEDSGPHEEHLVALGARLAEDPARLDLDVPVRDVGKLAGQPGLEPRLHQRFAQRRSRRGRLGPSTRHPDLPAATMRFIARARKAIINMFRYRRLTKVYQQIRDQPRDPVDGKRDRAAELRRPRPARIGEFQVVPRPRSGIARDHVEMDVRVDHHQHQIVDPLIGDERGERPFDQRDRVRLLGKGPARQRAVGRRVRLGGQHQAAQRHLRRPQQDQPMLELGDQRRRIAELQNRRVHRRPPACLRSMARDPKWLPRPREALRAHPWRS